MTVNLLGLKDRNLCQLLPLVAIFEMINFSCIALVNSVYHMVYIDLLCFEGNGQVLNLG